MNCWTVCLLLFFNWLFWETIKIFSNSFTQIVLNFRKRERKLDNNSGAMVASDSFVFCKTKRNVGEKTSMRYFRASDKYCFKLPRGIDHITYRTRKQHDENLQKTWANSIVVPRTDTEKLSI